MDILIVEDHPELARSLLDTAAGLRLSAHLAADGNTADRFLREQRFAMVVLDLALPGLDGLDVLKRLRAFDRHTPVLVLTARASIAERVQGLEAGADDYLTKPFDLAELEARVKALLRRSGAGVQNVCGKLHFDAEHRVFTVDGAALALTPREQRVLEVLAGRTGRVVAKEVLFDQVFALDADASREAIEVYVHRLRKKLAGSGAAIATLRGLGYMLQTEAA